jgi:TolA-binding protein
VLAALALALAGCSANSAKRHYLLAERLWSDGKYKASVSEFEKVVARDPKGKLGLQALQRAAVTQELFLHQYADAARKFRLLAERTGDAEQAWSARLQLGEILFAKTEQFDQAITHYRAMVQARPKAPEVPELLFRVGRSHFFLGQFEEAVAAYRDLGTRFPGTEWEEKAALETARSYFTRGEQRPGGSGPGLETYQQAMGAYREYIRKFPDSPRLPEAHFGIANCLEELDQLEAAVQAYEALRKTYPSPNVIEIKLARIRERKAQKSR